MAKRRVSAASPRSGWSSRHRSVRPSEPDRRYAKRAGSRANARTVPAAAFRVAGENYPLAGSAARDRIMIEGLRCFAHVGVPETERRYRQRLLLDITLELPLARAGKRDNMRAAVDYAAAAALAKQVVEGREHKLVEAIAERLATALLKAFPLVKSVSIRIRKFSIPQADSVGVEITRSRL